MLEIQGKVYKFSNLLFYSEESKLVCSKTGNAVFVRQIVRDFLLLLVEKPHQTLSFEDFQNSVENWKDYRQMSQLKRIIHTTKGELINRIRQLEKEFDLIEAVASKGYRLNADVSEVVFEKQDKQGFTTNKLVSESVEVFVSNNYFAHRLFTSLIYAVLYIVALFIEIAYQYQKFNDSIWSVSILVFVWMWLTTFLIISPMPKKNSQFKDLKKKILLCLVGFVLSSTILHFALGGFLPEYPITEARFQTYPAHAAYLKSILYFLPLGVFLILFPLISIYGLQNNLALSDKQQTNGEKTRYLDLNNYLLSVKVLAVLTLGAILVSFSAMTHLLDNLIPHPNQNLFVQLIWLRWVLYFVLAIECLVWFWLNLNKFLQKNF